MNDFVKTSVNITPQKIKYVLFFLPLSYSKFVFKVTTLPCLIVGGVVLPIFRKKMAKNGNFWEQNA